MKKIMASFFVVSMIGCGWFDSDDVTLSGNLIGLGDDKTITLSLVTDDTSEELELSENGDFVFDEQLSKGENYTVTISEEPDDQTCTIINGSGTGDEDNIDDITVTCI